MVQQEVQGNLSETEAATGRSWIIGLTSFLFILLQSACTAVMAISGLRLVIGITSLCSIGREDPSLDSRQCDPYPDGTACRRGLRHQSLCYLAGSVAARTTFFAMASCIHSTREKTSRVVSDSTRHSHPIACRRGMDYPHRPARLDLIRRIFTGFT
jgi:hypothetical protein